LFYQLEDSPAATIQGCDNPTMAMQLKIERSLKIENHLFKTISVTLNTLNVTFNTSNVTLITLNVTLDTLNVTLNTSNVTLITLNDHP
jgi:hypothetical protein